MFNWIKKFLGFEFEDVKEIIAPAVKPAPKKRKPRKTKKKD